MAHEKSLFHNTEAQLQQQCATLEQYVAQHQHQDAEQDFRGRRLLTELTQAQAIIQSAAKLRNRHRAACLITR